MRYLIDTSVLARRADENSPLRPVCTQAVRTLLLADEQVYICAQVLIELRAVATRPVDVNGMGLASAEAAALLRSIRRSLDCLPEPADMADRWQDLAEQYDVMGKHAHDARLAALMLAHGVTHILTLNPGDFARYDGITPVTPQEIHQTP